MWIWQQKNWTNFSFDTSALEALETEFLKDCGFLLGVHLHIKEGGQQDLKVEIIRNESISTSEIEGEYLNRDSLQSSIKKHFGLKTNHHKIPPAEQGIADMMVDLHLNFSKKLTHQSLFKWHKMLMSGRKDLHIGEYRKHKEPMQVVSGPLHKPKVHFEAPPSKNMMKEMTKFITWFNDSAPNGKKPLPALLRSSIAHLHFICIHPFEDGNGRIARALSLKVLSQNLKQPCLVSLSSIINGKKKAYYDTLEASNKSNEITKWSIYFAKIILAAGKHSQSLANLLITKAKFFERFNEQLNVRQKKVLQKMFEMGAENFEGGLSAEKYINITKTSRATATRDLQELVGKKILIKTGELKHSRYVLSNAKFIS
jgi:Fic family protein